METQETNIQLKPKNSLGAYIVDIIKIVLLAAIIIIPFRLLVAEPFVVSGSSMLPNYHNRDYLIVDRLSYRFNPPSRGDVIVLRYPRDNRQFFIKRIIGLPEETVKIETGEVYIFNKEKPNGFKLNEVYLSPKTQTLAKNDTVALGSEEYFVLGDNRMASSDSRVWGILPKKDIVGKAWFRIFPISGFGAAKSVQYK